MYLGLFVTRPLFLSDFHGRLSENKTKCKVVDVVNDYTMKV